MEKGDFLGFDDELDDNTFERKESEVFTASEGALKIVCKSTRDTPYQQECTFCSGTGYEPENSHMDCSFCHGSGDRSGLFIEDIEYDETRDYWSTDENTVQDFETQTQPGENRNDNN